MASDFAAGYTPPPPTSRYLNRFPVGETVIRILSNPIYSWSYWNKLDEKNPKPVRLPYDKNSYNLAFKEAMKNPKDEDKKVEHVWFLKIWNYDNDRIEIWELRQKTIREAVINLSNSKWGTPVNKYDISITKVGTTRMDTEYTVNPCPPSEEPEGLAEALLEPIDLNALFYSADPFDPSTWQEQTKADDDFGTHETDVQEDAEPVKKSKPKPKEEDIDIDSIPF